MNEGKTSGGFCAETVPENRPMICSHEENCAVDDCQQRLLCAEIERLRAALVEIADSAWREDNGVKKMTREAGIARRALEYDPQTHTTEKTDAV